jgi:hypothetical protein
MKSLKVVFIEGKRVFTTRACITFADLWTDSLQIWWKHTTDPQKLSVCMNACANSTRPYTFSHRSHVINKRFLGGDGQGLVNE